MSDKTVADYINADNCDEYTLVEQPHLLFTEFRFTIKNLKQFGVERTEKRSLVSLRRLDEAPMKVVKSSRRMSYGNLCRVYQYKDIEFILTPEGFIVKNKYAKDLVAELTHLQHKVNRTFKPVPVSTRSQFDVIKQRTSDLYMNEDQYGGILEAIKPFISTYSNRRALGINGCMGIILTGSPGDGKTFAAKKFIEAIATTLRMVMVEEEATAFQKAAKLEPNFVAMIDDMNLHHFQRKSGDICQNILSEMDRPGCNRLFFFTTNEAISKENIDRAFFRPGRVQAVINITKPDKVTKERIIKDSRDLLDKVGLKYNSELFNGLSFYVSEDDSLSLAEMMQVRKLVFTDILNDVDLLHPEEYVNRAKSISLSIPETLEHTHEDVE